MKHYRRLLVFLLVTLSLSSYSQGAASDQSSSNRSKRQAVTPVQKAICHLKGTKGSQITGTIDFIEQKEKDEFSSDSKLLVNVDITGAPDGNHGFHIHEFGDVSDNEKGLKTGGHYNPHNLPPHNCDRDAQINARHTGDMGNLNLPSENKKSFSLSGVYLHGATSIIGKSVILHENADNCTGPVGFAGGRIAQCVIGVAVDPNNEASLVIEDIYDLEKSNYYATCYLPNDTAVPVSGVITFKRIDESKLNITGVFPQFTPGSYSLRISKYGASTLDSWKYPFDSNAFSFETTDLPWIDVQKNIIGRNLSLVLRNSEDVPISSCVIGVVQEVPPPVNPPMLTSPEEQSYPLGKSGYSVPGIILGIIMASSVLIALVVYTIQNRRVGYQRTSAFGFS